MSCRELLTDVLGVEDVGAYYPHRVTYHPTCHSLRLLGVGDRPLRLLRRVAGLQLAELPDGDVLRLRGHLRGEERRHLGRHAGRQDAARAGHRGGGVHGRGRLVPDAHRRRPVPAAVRGADRAPGAILASTRPGARHDVPRDAAGGAARRGAPARRDPFPVAARRALADSQLRANLGKATTTIRAKRARVVAELPDWEQLRTAGEAIKAAAMAGLDEHLEQLEEQVTARGGMVHWARDAAEASDIVAGLVLDAGATEVVKVKSMATDEIGLNDALAARGITAWETDLAELIVQLGDDRPSHILVPAIHRNRAEIREIFLREMGGVDPG